MKVSVIIAVRDGSRYLGEAIESVIGQTHPDVELVVVDDGSVDASGEVARGYGDAVRYVRQERLGLAAARNRGLDIARGDLIAPLDADDVWDSDRLERQLPAIDRGMVFGYAEEFVSPELDAETRERLPRPRPPIPARIAGGMLASRDIFDRVGRFSTEVRVGEFLDWYLRARDAGVEEHLVPARAVWRRIHPDNMTLARRDEFASYTRALRASLLRRRTGST